MGIADKAKLNEAQKAANPLNDPDNMIVQQCAPVAVSVSSQANSLLNMFSGKQTVKYTYSNPTNSPVLARLIQIVVANELYTFYPPDVLYSLDRQLQEVIDFKALATKHGLSIELAYELSCLALYDIVLFIDDSGSMTHGSRIPDMKYVVGKLADIVTTFDTDGIAVRFINSNATADNITNEHDINALVGKIIFNLGTPIGEQLYKKVLHPHVVSETLKKPVYCIIVTDGEPSDREPKFQLRNVIGETAKHVKSTYGTSKAVCYQFAQVGNDPGAAKFLDGLDNDTVIGDFVDTTSDYEQESIQFNKKSNIVLTPEFYCVKLLQGAVDSVWDAND